MSKTTSSLSTPMARVRGLGAAKSGTGHFWLTRLTAVANVPLTIAFVVIVLMLAKADYAAAMKIVGHPVAGIVDFGQEDLAIHAEHAGLVIKAQRVIGGPGGAQTVIGPGRRIDEIVLKDQPAKD